MDPPPNISAIPLPSNRFCLFEYFKANHSYSIILLVNNPICFSERQGLLKQTNKQPQTTAKPNKISSYHLTASPIPSMIYIHLLTHFSLFTVNFQKQGLKSIHTLHLVCGPPPSFAEFSV